MIATRLTIVLAGLVMALAGPMRSACSEPPDADRAAIVKAGLVLNFIRYTDWPDKTFPTGESPVIVTILGRGGMSDIIEQTIRDKQVHGRIVEVRSLASPKPLAGESQVSEDRLLEFRRSLRASNAVFVCESERDSLKTVLRELGDSDILTISDIDNFAECGGMLGLAIRSDKVAFDANLDRIEKTRLKVSSQLLRLARSVKSQDQ